MEKKQIDYQTAYDAVHGNHEAQLEVLDFFDSYINSKAVVEEKNEDGSVCHYVDEDMKANIQAGLLAALPKCKIMR